MALPERMAFNNSAARYPFNCALFSDEIIIEKAQDDSLSSEIRAVAVAEVLVRYFLSRREEYRPLLERMFGAGILDNFVDLCDRRFDGAPIPSANIFQIIEAGITGYIDRSLVAREIDRRFEFLFKVSGFIPVFNGTLGYLVPFSITRIEKGPSSVVDADDCELTDWTHALCKIPQSGKNSEGVANAFSVRVGISSGAKSAEEKILLTGRSLMLPLQMAVWRENGDLPRYNPLRVISTGTFDPSGKLDFVDVTAKITAVENSLRDGVLIFPNSGKYAELDRVVKLPAGLSPDQILSYLRPFLEKMFATDTVYAIRRLNELGLYSKVQLSRYGKWGEMIQCIENLRNRVSRLDSPDEYLAYTMLLSMANCHAGNTVRAMELNENAVKFAREKDGYDFQLAHLQIDHLVMLTDIENFDLILNRAAEFEKGSLSEIRAGQDERSFYDLEMRFCGTMGQAYAYGALSGRQDCDPQKAKRFFNRAFAAAKKLYEIAGDEKVRDQCLCDMAHDANYLHLWDVLFEPEYAGESYHDAETQLNRIADESGKRKNYLFLLRQQAFSWYREILRASAVRESLDRMHMEKIVRDMSAIKSVYAELTNDSEVVFWLRAVTLKYLGAVMAVSGEYANAVDCFNRAADLLEENNKYGDAVINKIQMTVRAEACRSLSDQPACMDDVEKFREKGLEFFGQKSDAEMSDPWYVFLKGESNDFPGLKYWY